MDKVGFQGVYQVRHPCLRSTSRAHWVDLVQGFKVDQVHPAFPPDFHTRFSLLTFLSRRLREKEKWPPGTVRVPSTPRSKENLLPRAEKGPGAPRSKEKQLPGAEKGPGAPGRKKTLLPGAEKGSGAPGGKEKRLPGAEKGPGAPGSAG